MKPLTGYHTLADRGNYDTIERNGPIKCTGSNAWLGDGYYFWDTDEHWAHHWGEVVYRRKGEDYYIFEARIKRDDSMFDLYGTVAHEKAFFEIAQAFVRIKKIKLEDTSIRQIIQYMRKNAEAFPYTSIRVYDTPIRQNHSRLMVRFLPASFGRTEAMALYEARVQICLLTKVCMVPGSFKLFFPES